MRQRDAKPAARANAKPKPLPARNALGQWLPGVCGCPRDKLKIVKGHQWRWQPGQSGNPAGTTKARAEFEREFYGALIGQGSPDEAARLLWECARGKEAWAVQMILDRLAPKDSKMRLEVSRADDEGFDATKLSPEQLDELVRLMEIAHGEPQAIESGALRA